MQTDELWQDVQTRNAAADGRFVYSVRTTGVYCRPGCPSRLARRENVAFHPDANAAEAAGFRPCLRCDPRGHRHGAAVIAAICRRIDSAETPPSLADLARHAGYSPHHLHRLFKAVMGITPRAYAAGRRGERVRAQLDRGNDVTSAVYEAGYNAPSRFYAEAPGLLGMAPTAARRGGAGETIRYATGATRLGAILVAETARGICAVSLGEDAADLIAALHRRFPAASITFNPNFATCVAQVTATIEQGAPTHHLPLDLRGTAFQMRVWQELRRLPRGATLTYGQLADRLGQPTAARAVARACATNHHAVLIPCHRVVAANGNLSGYRWGKNRKQTLLAAERQERPADHAAASPDCRSATCQSTPDGSCT